MNEEDELDPIEKELREAQEQYDAENQQVYDEVTKGNEEIRRKRTKDNDDEQLELPLESRNLARVGAGLAFEVGANSLLDALTLVPGSQAVGSAVINTIAQGIRGGKFSFGEVLGSAAASQIPGLAQGKAITKAGRITRAAGTGAVSGAIETTSIAAVDEGRLPTAQEFGLGVGAGGVLGAGFAQAADLADPRVTGIFRDLRARINGSQTPFLQGSVGAGYIGPTSKGFFEPGVDAVVPLPKGAPFDADTVNDYVQRAYIHRAERVKEGTKTNLMKGFDETLLNKSNQEFILVKKRVLKNKQVPAAFENYDLRSVAKVEDEIIARSGYEVKQDKNVKFLQQIRRELNNIKQQDPKLYLTNLMEYGDAAYLEHKVARRMAGNFWTRVEAQRPDDIENGLFQWTGAKNRNTLENLRLLFDPNYKTLKDTTEGRLNALVANKRLPDAGEPEGFVITIEDPNEATFSAKSLFVRSNPGNLQIRKAGTGKVVGVIPDFYRQIYSTEFATAYKKNYGALASPEVDVKIRARAGESIQQYRDRIIGNMLDDAVSGKGVLSEADYLEDLAMFYGTFAGFYRKAVDLGAAKPDRWVRIPRWAMDVISDNTDIDRYVSDTVTPVAMDVDTQNSMKILNELEETVRALPRTKTGKIERRFAKSVKPDLDKINEIRKKLNLPKFKL